MLHRRILWAQTILHEQAELHLPNVLVYYCSLLPRFHNQGARWHKREDEFNCQGCAWRRVNPGFIFCCFGKLIEVEASGGLGGFARRGGRREITGTGCPDKRSWARRGEIIHLTVVSFMHRDGGFSGEGTAPGAPRFSGSTINSFRFSTCVFCPWLEDLKGSECGLICGCWWYQVPSMVVLCSLRMFDPTALSKIRPLCRIGARPCPAHLRKDRYAAGVRARLPKYAPNQTKRSKITSV